MKKWIIIVEKKNYGCIGCANEKKGTMIYAKYQIGQKVWVVDANKDNKDVEVYSDIISGIFVDRKGDIYYYLAEILDDIIQEKVFPYEDTDRLVREIIKADNEINLKGE